MDLPGTKLNCRSVARVLLVLSGALIVVIVAWLLMLLIPVIADPVSGDKPLQGKLLFTEVIDRWQQGDSSYIKVKLRSSTGLEVTLSVRKPLRLDSPKPLVIFLGGQRTGSDANQLVDKHHGLVLVALDYSHSIAKGQSTWKVLSDLPKIQQAIVNSTPAVLLALDYLLQQAYINPDHVEIVGVSLGAFLVSTPAALDSRIKRTWLIHGSAQPEKVFDHLLQDDLTSAFWRRHIAQFFATVIASHHLKAEKWVGQISPRPVVFINARHDEMLPADSVALLHESANEPVEYIWMEGPHIRPYRRDVITQISRQVLSRIAEEAKEGRID